MDKSPDAFRTISEVADDLDLPQHVLRFWETRFNQIKPMKRGGGRRYYRPQDVDLIKGIRHLLYDQGYTIKGVQRLLKDNGTPFVVALGSGDMSAIEAIAQRRRGAVGEELRILEGVLEEIELRGRELSAVVRLRHRSPQLPCRRSLCSASSRVLRSVYQCAPRRVSAASPARAQSPLKVARPHH